jgi:hypothetical protein
MHKRQGAGLPVPRRKKKLWLVLVGHRTRRELQCASQRPDLAGSKSGPGPEERDLGLLLPPNPNAEGPWPFASARGFWTYSQSPLLDTARGVLPVLNAGMGPFDYPARCVCVCVCALGGHAQGPGASPSPSRAWSWSPKTIAALCGGAAFL